MKIDFLTPTLTVHVWKKRDQQSTDELYVMYFVHIVLESSKRTTCHINGHLVYLNVG